MERTNKPEHKQGVSIAYQRPLSTHRMYASIVDFAIFALLTMLLLFATTSIFKTTDYYKTNQGTIDEIKIASCLYDEDVNGNLALITKTHTLETDSVASQVKTFLVRSIEGYQFADNDREKGGFLGFCDEISIKFAADLKDFGKTMREDYDNYRLKTHKNFFEVKNGKIVENGKAKDLYYVEQIYEPFIKDYAAKEIVKIPTYLVATQNLSTMMLAVEIPVPILVSVFLTFFLPGLIFKRGRKSIGKLAFKIGIVGENYLNLSVGKYLLRSTLIFFETVLFLPAVISFTTMVVGKRQFTLHDYFMKTNIVETREHKIYFTKLDAYLDSIKNESKPVEFENISRI